MINIGIIGLGYWGPNYARLCFELKDVNLAWCADSNTEALQKINQRYPATKITPDYKMILQDPDLDAVVIVTPAQTHFKIAKDALLAGKNILLEKPLTAKLSEAQELEKLVKKLKKILMVDHIFKFNPAVQKLKNFIKSGELGKIYYLSASYTALGPIRKDVDAMWDLAPHWIYVMGYLLDSRPISVSAKGGEFLKDRMNDVVFLNLEFPQKILANIHVSWLYPQKVRSMAIVGNKKMAVFDDVSSEAKLTLYDKGAKYNSQDPNFANLQIIFHDGDVVIPKIENKEPLREVFSHFLKCVKEKKSPLVDVREGVEVVEILEKASESIRRDGATIPLKI